MTGPIHHLMPIVPKTGFDHRQYQWLGCVAYLRG